MLKKLNYFSYFDAEAFLEGKRLMVTNISDWKDFSSGELLGKKVEAIIIEDNTDYGEGADVSNLFEKLVFKTTKEINIPIKSEIVCTEVEAVVYGDHRNQLSLKTDNIKIVKPTA